MSDLNRLIPAIVGHQSGENLVPMDFGLTESYLKGDISFATFSEALQLNEEGDEAELFPENEVQPGPSGLSCFDSVKKQRKRAEADSAKFAVGSGDSTSGSDREADTREPYTQISSYEEYEEEPSDPETPAESTDDEYVPDREKKRRKKLVMSSSKLPTLRKANSSRPNKPLQSSPKGKKGIADSSSPMKSDVDSEQEEDADFLSAVLPAKSERRNKLGFDEEEETRKIRRVATGPRQLPDELQSLLGQANLNFVSGQKEDAVKMVEEVIRQKPNFPDGYNVLASFYDELGEQDKRLQCALLAAHLRPNLPADAWLDLAELCATAGKPQQAIACYAKAIRVEPTRAESYEKKIQLHSQLDEVKLVLKTHQKAVQNLWKTQQPTESFIEFARDIAKQSYDNGDLAASISCFTSLMDRELLEEDVIYDDLNMLVELQLHETKFRNAADSMLKFGRIKLFAGNEQVDVVDPFPPKGVTTFEFPHDFPIDLKGKLVIAWINLEAMDVALALLTELSELYSFEEDGDVFFDIAECLMENGYFKEAEKILSELVQTEDFNAAAVWLRYAETLQRLDSVDAAMRAFRRVIELAPSHVEARLNLARLQQELGREAEALRTLSHVNKDALDEVNASEMNEFQGLDERLLYQKCLLLENQKDRQKFIRCAKQLLAMYFHDSFSSFEMSRRALPNRCNTDVRLVCQQTVRNSRLEYLVINAGPANKRSFTGKEIWRIYKKIIDDYETKQNFTELLHLSCYAAACPFFNENGYLVVTYRMLMVAAIWAKQPKVLWTLVRTVFHDEKDTRVWNLYDLVFVISNDEQLRNWTKSMMRDAINRHPDSIPLAIIAANASLITGSYQHALLEFMNLLDSDEVKDDPFVYLMIGNILCAMCCRKDLARRHDIFIQGLAFLSHYESLRGPCQEVFYNLGRIMQQTGLLFAATHYYRRVLECSCAVPDGLMKFDLSREAAHNLALIYQNSGNGDLAMDLYQQFCVI